MPEPSRSPPDPGAGLPSALAATAGAYAVVLRLDRPIPLTLAAGPSLSLAAGLYLYAGSARGPGGIRARVARHLRRDKAPHWHIDQVTAAATVLAVASWPGGSECALLRRALAIPGAGVPIPGFGSSDCRTCPAHLVALPDAATLNRLSGRRAAPGTGAGPAGNVSMLWLQKAGVRSDRVDSI